MADKVVLALLIALSVYGWLVAPLVALSITTIAMLIVGIALWIGGSDG